MLCSDSHDIKLVTGNVVQAAAKVLDVELPTPRRFLGSASSLMNTGNNDNGWKFARTATSRRRAQPISGNRFTLPTYNRFQSLGN